ncbi:uncharacterized protein L3040_002535 [Drepanopeziza brunnea f. sp. 'multigermtubi']|uniref:2EXR domain-containing protein n=1 Tax=Marssonina brunnea f. sp. multigermtubi (strain MB_m1) TaxID=1072389 RepID=K1X3K5_MARBU|nr:uncharacterized protein MBM_02824 [Drepanopeziza brunnea f. sp. 'multigermtubi' MB_m1]EKD19587.1 hypothetical protein MBM_02824 [Drepanopeziza brunnea f. sp. 'multigermtubi' MB_m1]KAJ5050660.1 hypothetical protein L3040_002535 [Drepanopeziza brunnea f. sp. 'multigermtubi']
MSSPVSKVLVSKAKPKLRVKLTVSPKYKRSTKTVAVTPKNKGKGKELEVPEGTFTEFTVFLNLPPELQLEIWKLVIGDVQGRIVTLKDSPVPAFLHVCSTSRKQALKSGYDINVRNMQQGRMYNPVPINLDLVSRSADELAVFINPNTDIFFLGRTGFPSQIEYHINAFHTLLCLKVEKSMLQPVQRLALTISEVLQIWHTLCFHCFLLQNFEGLFPNLNELIIIIRPGTLGSGFDDLYEVETSDLELVNNVMTDIRNTFKCAKEEGHVKGVKLTFMRMETFVR